MNNNQGIPNANRWALSGDLIQLPRNTPGPIYSISDKFKYKESSKWPFGNSKRPPIYSNECFEYYKHKYADIEVIS